MSPRAIAEYVARLLAKSDEDAFHSLIEQGDQSVQVVRDLLPTCTNEQSQRLIEVLQEIRTDQSRSTLQELCRLPYSEQWVMAAEGLVYNDPDSARPLLLAILAEDAERGRGAKSVMLKELLGI